MSQSVTRNDKRQTEGVNQRTMSPLLDTDGIRPEDIGRTTNTDMGLENKYRKDKGGTENGEQRQADLQIG